MTSSDKLKAICLWLRKEANFARHAQDAASKRSTDKRYRMGQKDAYLFAADAIERGDFTACMDELNTGEALDTSRLRERLIETFDHALNSDPICNGRVGAGTVEYLADEAIRAGEAMVRKVGNTREAETSAGVDTHDLKWAIVRAYVQGAEDAHNNYEEDRDPDFKEAGCDYADSIDLAALTSTRPNAGEEVERLALALFEARGEHPQGSHNRLVDGAWHSATFLQIAEADVRTILAALQHSVPSVSGDGK